MSELTPEEIIVNHRIIREWHRGKAADRFRCSYWDCPKWIEEGDEYYADYDDEQEPYCLSCSATFMMYSSNEMFKVQQKSRRELRDRLKRFEEVVKSNYNCCFACPSWEVEKARKDILALFEEVGQ